MFESYNPLSCFSVSGLFVPARTTNNCSASFQSRFHLNQVHNVQLIKSYGPINLRLVVLGAVAFAAGSSAVFLRHPFAIHRLWSTREGLVHVWRLCFSIITIPDNFIFFFYNDSLYRSQSNFVLLKTKYYFSFPRQDTALGHDFTK